ncbi:MAG: cyclic nucleotide-binding domain-containing protein [Betaproteobacteria bacterium]|nr:cyclic nucleotide-binding domain-containing protein [Betaproteobacteria bacterium]
MPTDPRAPVRDKLSLFDHASVALALRRAPADSITRTHPDDAALAARLLATPSALAGLHDSEAEVVVSYMVARFVQAGAAFIREGDAQHTGFMLLILDGEATVESLVVSRSNPMVLSVIGPGSVLGEMGVIDGSPRSATCTASTDLRVAVLSRDRLQALLDDHPRLGAKLLLALGQRLAERLRDVNQKLRSYGQLVQAMQEELNEQIVKAHVEEQVRKRMRAAD